MTRRLRLRAWPLRRRLVVVTTLLATLAVLASQAAGLAALDTWFTHRVDRQLAEFHLPPRAFADAQRAAAGSTRTRDPLPSDFRVRFYSPSGRLVAASLGDNSAPGPHLAGTLAESGLRRGQPATTDAVSGGNTWRVLRVRGPEQTDAVIALPLATVQQALARLLWLNLAVLALTATSVAAAGYVLTRLGLLPLTRMERTAQRIAGGDRQHSLTDTDPGTETGRLGRALDTMWEELHEALRRRQESEDRLRGFVADAGHELRTPLTSLQGFAELLQHEEQLTPERRAEAHRLVAQNAARMGRLVDDLLLLAQLDREPTHRPHRVDLLSIAADCVATAASANEPDDHPTTLGPLPNAPSAGGLGALDVVEVWGDPHRLQQVVTNLLTNARAHTAPGTPVHLRVGVGFAGARTGGTDRPGRTSPSPALTRGARVTVLEVLDEGPGLTPEEATRVFGRFYRGEQPATGAREGTGLGLAIAATIAEHHDGRLELDTGPGPGCRFRLVLPTDPPERHEG